MLRGVDVPVKQGLRRRAKDLRSRAMNMSHLLAGLAAFALISTPALAQKSPEATAEAAPEEEVDDAELSEVDDDKKA